MSTKSTKIRVAATSHCGILFCNFEIQKLPPQMLTITLIENLAVFNFNVNLVASGAF